MEREFNIRRILITLAIFVSLIFACIPFKSHAAVVVNYPTIYGLTVEKTWDDNGDALGLRPDKVVFDLYMYTGEWTGVKDAKLVHEGLELTADDAVYKTDEDGYSTGEIDENVWSKTIDMGLFSELPNLGYYVPNYPEAQDTYPTSLTDENGEKYKLKFVERDLDGYVESSSVDPTIFTSEFSVTEAQTLEKVGDNQYKIPDFEKVKAAIKKVNDDYENGNRNTSSDQPLPLLIFETDGARMVIPLTLKSTMNDSESLYYGITKDLFYDYMEKAYDLDNYSGIDLIDEVSMDDLIDLIYEYENPEDIFEDRFFEISTDGILTMKNGIVFGSVSDSGMTSGYSPNPVYDYSGSDVTATVHMVTPLNRLQTELAKSTNKLKEPVSVTVEKTWEGDKAKDRPKEISVELLSNGDVVDTKVLNSKNGWTYTWDDLDDMKSGEELTYTVREKKVPSGYTSEVNKISEEETSLENGIKGTKISYEIVNTKSQPQYDENEEDDEIVEDDDKDDETPKTGDDSNILLWTILLAASIAFVGFGAKYLHREK